MLMKWKSLFAAALTAAVALPAWAQESTGGGTPSLSFSFANGRSGARTTVMPTSHESLGIHSVPVAQWIDLDDEDVSANNLPINATDVVQVGDSHANFTLPAPVYVSYSAANGWSHKGTDTRTILQTYLDDGNNGASILVKNVPFTKYDVIVYLATDNVNAKFRPVTINGTRYAWTQFGTTENPWSNWSTENTGTLIVNADANATFGRSQQDIANLGQNAIRVDGLETQTLTIQGSTGIQNNNTGRIERCGIAAIQIIQASDGAIRDTATYQPVISVNMKGNVDSIVGTSGFSGLNPTLNAYWNELSASGNSESGVGFADDLGLATTLAIDATYAGELWNVASAGRSTLGDMANGYRDTKQLTLTAVPYSSYDVILYFASDLHGGEGASAKPWTPVQVTDANGASKWYSYPADYTVPENGAAKAADANPGDWGTTADCHTADAAVAYGKAVMKIADLSGDVTLAFPRNTDDNSSANRSGLYGFQIVCTDEEIEPPPPSISVSVIGGNNPDGTWTALPSIKSTEGQSGLADYRVDNANWNELTQQNSGNTGGTPETLEAPVDNTGAPTFATVTARLGGWWHLQGTEASKAARMDAVGYMGVGFCDPSKVADTNELTLANVPYTEYSLILYYGTNHTGNKWAAPKVTFADGTFKTYTYAADAAGAATEGTDAWGSTTAATTSGQAGTLGKDVMLIEGLSGNISIDLGTQPNDGAATQAGSLCGFQIVCTGEIVGALAPSSVMSLNFASGGTGDIKTSTVSDQTGNFGLAAVPAASWVDLTGNTTTSRQTVTTLYGEADVADWAGAKVTWNANNSYSYKTNQVTAETEPFLKTYLDDGSGASVTVANLPFAAYDVIVYNATDSGKAFRLVTVNGVKYTWDANFGLTIATEDDNAIYGPNETDGVSGLPTATLGTNALRVDGLTASTLSIQGYNVGTISGDSDTYVRAGIAAVQIVARKLITVSTQTDWATLSAGLSASDPVLIVFQDGGSITGDVTLPADTILDFSDYTFGETAPFTGTLTMAGGTIRLPERFDSAKIAASISGSFTCFIGNELVWLSNQGGTLSLSYEWSGYGGDNLWSNPYNWSSRLVPDKNAEVSFTLGTGEEVVILDEAATVASVTITGTENASLEIQATNGGSLTVSGQMLTTGNVTVTQSADITVRGATKTGVFYPGTQYETTQPVQAGFHIHQGTWKILSGTLAMPPDGGNLTGEAGISGNGTLIVGGEGASGAKLAVHQLSHIFYNETLSLAYGTLRVAAGGTLTASNAVSLAVNYGHTYTVDLAGGTIETPTLATFAGVTVSDDSSLRAPNGGTLNVTLPRGSSGDALTGTGGVTLSGTVTIESALTGYTGTLTVSAGAALTLSDDARPSLVLEDNASLTVTPTDGEAGSGTIVFPTSMTEEPTGVKYTVSGVDEEETLSVSVDGGKLTLSWGADYPTLSTTSNWSTTESWANLPNGTTYPSEGSAILDGTNLPITVTLDTDLSKMTSIFVKGNVTLVTKGTQFTTIPACVKLTTGATLTVDADFSGAWELPDGTTLQVTEDFTSFANLTLEGAVVILSEASGTAESPTVIEAPSPVEFNGGLTIAASNLTLTSVYNVGKTLALAGDNITIAGNRFFTDIGTQVVNTGTDNVITGMTGLNGSLAVEGGTLALTLGASPTNTFSGATIAKGATLTLAAVPDSSTGVTTARGWFFPVTGDGKLVVEVGGYDFRPMFSAVSQEATTLPKNMVFTATKAEQAAGLISCLNNNNSATLPEGLTVTVNPAAGGGAWVPNAVLESGVTAYLRIYNKLPTNLPVGVEEAIAEAIQQAAETAGLTKAYTVQLTTKGQPVEVTADVLNDVLGCFTNLTATAEGSVLTYAYDFGIVGVKRNTADNGWVVTAKVQGANAGAGFAEGNVYTLTVNGEEVSVTDATVGEGGTVELTLPDSAVQGDGPLTLGVKVSRPAQTPAQ